MKTMKIPATGFEPVTSGLGNQRSIQLSYAGLFLQRYRGSGRFSTQPLPKPPGAGQYCGFPTEKLAVWRV